MFIHQVVRTSLCIIMISGCQQVFLSFCCFSFRIEQDPYLLDLADYVHINPLRSGTLKDLDALMNKQLPSHPPISWIFNDNGPSVFFYGEVFESTLLHSSIIVACIPRISRHGD